MIIAERGGKAYGLNDGSSRLFSNHVIAANIWPEDVHVFKVIATA